MEKLAAERRAGSVYPLVVTVAVVNTPTTPPLPKVCFFGGDALSRRNGLT
jgi:hypothetical protein